MPWFRRSRTPNAPLAPARPFFWLNGRRHFAAAPYVLPNDPQEIHRLDLQHFLFRQVLQRHYLAPLRQPLSILDVGTGTGRWAKEVAAAFPQSNIMGADIVPPDGTTDTPANCLFVAGNVLTGLPFADQSFALVHQRMLFLAIPLPRWPNVAQELTRVTQPGGWVELLEAGIVHQGGPAMTALMQWATLLTRKQDIDVNVGAQLPNFLRQAGLTHVTFHTTQIPVGAYGGRLGAMMASDVLAVVTALRGPVLAQGIATAADYDAALQAVVFENQGGPWRGVWPIHIAYGQRRR